MAYEASHRNSSISLQELVEYTEPALPSVPAQYFLFGDLLLDFYGTY